MNQAPRHQFILHEFGITHIPAARCSTTGAAVLDPLQEFL
jgi:hypothetical protein